MRKKLVICWLCCLFAAIISVFWYTAWVYALPTPVPANYIPVHNGTKVFQVNHLGISLNKPVFLHFFNPDCPCSRFNIEHFTSLVKQYGNQVNFVVIPVTNKPYTAKQIQQKLRLQIPVVFDTTIATACGVYSTPQAVVINTDTTLYFRGNYNKSRYCTDVQTSYAKTAIENVLMNKRNTVTSAFAVKAYGCGLPACTKP